MNEAVDKNKHFYSTNEEQYIIDNSTVLSAEEMAAKLERSVTSVEHKRSELQKEGKIKLLQPQRSCEWCGETLPRIRYHLRICPDCRKASISAFKRGHLKK